MNLAEELRAERHANASPRSLTREQFDNLGLLADASSSAGVVITQQTALGISAFWNGVNVISGDVGMLDRFVYRKLEDDARERATTHPAYRIVHDSPNPQMTAMTFWQTFLAHALTWGNGYAEIEWDNAMRPIALWPIPPNMIESKLEVLVDERGRKSTRLYYVYNGQDRIEAEDVLHVPGLCFNGVRGYSVVQIARQSLGLSLAAERFGAAFFSEGAWPGLALQMEKELSEGAQQRLKKQFAEQHQGPGKAHRLIVLEEGLKVSKPLTIPPNDAQFLETREHQIDDIARWLNLPPSKLKHRMGERPGGNLEAAQMEYQTGTLLPWTTRIEQECQRKLIAQRDRGTFYVEHEFRKLLKPDSKTRSEIQKTYVEMKVLTPTQVARQENLPDPEPQEPAVSPAPAAASAAPADGARVRAEQIVAYRKIVRSEVKRYVRREAERVRQAAKKGDAASFERWVEDFYERERQALEEILEPLVTGCASLFRVNQLCAATVSHDYITRSKDELLSLPRKALPSAVERLTDRWESERIAGLTDAVLASLAEEE